MIPALIFMHPAMLIFAFVILLAIFRKQMVVFTALALSYPLLVGLLICRSTTFKFAFFQLDFLFSFGSSNRLICLAFTIVTLAANLFALSNSRQSSLISGGIYFGLALFCISADDYLSMFVFLEMMLLSSALLIVFGDHQDRFRRAKQYFLTHLFSGSLILVGIIWLINLAPNTQITNLSYLMQDNHPDNLYLYLLLIGSLINVAAFPFCFWLTSCYPASGSAELLYLINFTTKVAIVILIRLFSGLPILIIFGVLTIIYSIVGAARENNIRKLLCFLSIAQLGFMLLGASISSEIALESLNIYIFMHILYKCLLTLCSGYCTEKANIVFCTDLPKIDNFLLKFSLSLVIISMLALPLTTIFYSKVMLLSELNDRYAASTVFLLGIFTLVMLPVKEYFSSSLKVKIDLDIYAKLSLILVSIILLIFNFFFYAVNYLDGSRNAALTYLAFGKQALVIGLAVILAIICKKSHRNHSSVPAISADRLSDFCRQSFGEMLKKLLARHNLNYFNVKNWHLAGKIDVLNITIIASFTLFFVLLLTLAS